ncbi:MAG: serine acetyltransferase [Spirochaetaceae bacterium]|jgi:serine O-acetyltransferase|nr:serine acetyltransferase [Spirochaetaceae bacterium]
MNIDISQISENLMDSYKLLGGINHLGETTLPSRAAVETMLFNMESLIFPGFQEEELLEQDYIAFNLGEKLNRLAAQLTFEIAKSLRYKCLMEKKVCNKDCKSRASSLAIEFLSQIPQLREQAFKDVQAALDGDPAAQSVEEIILSYPGLEAVVAYRIAHMMYQEQILLIPRMISEFIHRKTGIDIHPGADIGEYFFIDHGTGVVIGETTKIGNHVKIYQGVTLGALSVKKEEANKKRHPTIEDLVTIYSGATILGGNTVIGENSVIGGNVWITSSLENNRLFYRQGEGYKIRNKEA